MHKAGEPSASPFQPLAAELTSWPSAETTNANAIPSTSAASTANPATEMLLQKKECVAALRSASGGQCHSDGDARACGQARQGHREAGERKQQVCHKERTLSYQVPWAEPAQRAQEATGIVQGSGHQCEIGHR